MTQSLIAYGAAAAAFLVIDVIWLARVARQFYRNRLGALLADRPRLASAVAFYLLYIAGIVIFAVDPALDRQSAAAALGNGALFGFFAYATYDLTNHATLRNWPLSVSLVDLAWGTALTAVAALAGYIAGSWAGASSI